MRRREFIAGLWPRDGMARGGVGAAARPHERVREDHVRNKGHRSYSLPVCCCANKMRIGIRDAYGLLIAAGRRS
jgi:hypothetical protein